VLSDDVDKIVKEANILPMRYWDDPILSKVCDKIEESEFGPKLEEFGRELIATMNDRNGIGLAGPQVGVGKRIFAMGFPDHKENPPLVMCNPTLILTGRTVPGREGCLSLPNVYEQVYRAESVVMKYTNPLGKQFEILLLTPFDARVAQHEADHLDGIMFFDYKDKREKYVTPQYPEPRGARMSKNLSKYVLKEWEKVKKAKGL
jgi:peptide deformylase